MAFLPQVNDTKSKTLLYLNPLSSWSDTYDNQLVNMETYQRLVKQEYNELRISNQTTTAASNQFQQYYHNFSNNDLNEIKVID